MAHPLRVSGIPNWDAPCFSLTSHTNLQLRDGGPLHGDEAKPRGQEDRSSLGHVLVMCF